MSADKSAFTLSGEINHVEVRQSSQSNESLISSWASYEPSIQSIDSLIRLIQAKSLTVPGSELKNELDLVRNWSDLITCLATPPQPPLPQTPLQDLSPASAKPSTPLKPGPHYSEVVGDDVMGSGILGCSPSQSGHLTQFRGARCGASGLPLQDMMASKLETLLTTGDNVFTRRDLIAVGCEGYLVASRIAFVSKKSDHNNDAILTRRWRDTRSLLI
jgi:hypothetical protein